MKSFDEWFKQPVAPIVSKEEAEESLAEEKGLSGYTGHRKARCCICESHYDLPCDVEEFDPDMSYCGGSPRCIP